MTVEDLLGAFALAHNTWLDPEVERENPVPEYAALIRRAVDVENAKLRDELAKWEQLTDGIDLPEYPVTQFVPKDLERENAKLRELVRDMWHEGMCECGSLGKCAACIYEYPTRMRELGIEVDG